MDTIALQKLLDSRKEIEENKTNIPALHKQIVDMSFVGLYNTELKEKIREQADKINLHNDPNGRQNFVESKTEILKIIDDIIQGVYKFNLIKSK